MDQTLIEQIVANVLAQLQPAAASRAEGMASLATEVQLDHPIITADVLEDRVRNGQLVQIGAKSILTPSARDWLRENNIRWQRAGRTSANAVAASRRILLIGTVTPAVRNLREALTGWKQELLGRPAELAEAAVRAIASGDAELVVAVSEAADVVACRANRNDRVRAAVVTSVEHLHLLAEHLGPNVLVINPRGRSFVELRNLLRALAALPAPKNRHQEAQG